jgi:hypothetical protein
MLNLGVANLPTGCGLRLKPEARIHELTCSSVGKSLRRIEELSLLLRSLRSGSLGAIE